MFQVCVCVCVCVCVWEVGLKSRCSQKCSGGWQGFRQAVKCKLACNTSSWECRGCLAIRHSPRVSHKRILFSEWMSSAFCTGSFKLNVGKRRVLSKHNSLASLKAGARLSCRLCSLLFIGGLFASPLHTPGKLQTGSVQDARCLHHSGTQPALPRLFRAIKFKASSVASPVVPERGMDHVLLGEKAPLGRQFVPFRFCSFSRRQL